MVDVFHPRRLAAILAADAGGLAISVAGVIEPTLQFLSGLRLAAGETE